MRLNLCSFAVSQVDVAVWIQTQGPRPFPGASYGRRPAALAGSPASPASSSRWFPGRILKHLCGVGRLRLKPPTSSRISGARAKADPQARPLPQAG